MVPTEHLLAFVFVAFVLFVVTRSPVEPRTLRRILADGFAVGVLNPKVMAGAARSWLLTSPRRPAAIGGTGGLVMIGLGAGLAVSGRPKS